MSLSKMALGTMALEKLKKVRSWDELKTRGGQAFSAFREQRRVPHVPSDEELVGLIDARHFGNGPIIAESLWQNFFKHGEKCFFSSLRNPALAGKHYRRIFGDTAANRFVSCADEILDGRVSLLGLKSVYVGTEIDWHREPVSAKRSPLKHWKEFDDIGSGETGNKKIVWELNRHQHFFTLGVAYVLTGDERYASVFVRHLESWMEQNPPAVGVNWSSSLEVAFRVMSWIWGLHLFRNSDALTPEMFRRVMKYIYLHGRHIEQYLSTYYSPNTHLTGEALALYYLGTQLRMFKRAERWRRLGEDILFDQITKQVLPDGVYFEQSTWYQRYTLDIFSHFTILRSLDRDARPDLRTPEFEERLQAAFDHAMHTTMPDGTTPLLGDDDGGRLLPLTSAAPDDFRGTLSLSSVIFDRPDHKFVAGSRTEDVFWLMGASGVASYEQHAASEPEATSSAFVNGGCYTMRDGWEDTDNLMIVDCGEVGALSAGHGHADALSMAVAIHGRSTLVDSGTYTYHESREMRDYFRSSIAHNTLAVDGRSSSEPGSAFSWQTRANAKVNTWLAEERFDLFEGEHDGYQRLSDPVIHRRSILFLKNDYWIIRDTAETAGDHEYALNFHFAEDVKPFIGEHGHWVGNDDHRIFTFGDHGSWERKESWISKNHGNKVNAPYMRYVSEGAGTQEFFSFILPSDRAVKPPTVEETPTLNGRAFVIKYDRYTDAFVFNDEPGHLIETGIFDTDFQYSWARLTDTDRPDEIVLLNGTRLAIGGREMLGGRHHSFVTVRCLGSELYLKTPDGRFTATS